MAVLELAVATVLKEGGNVKTQKRENMGENKGRRRRRKILGFKRKMIQGIKDS